MFCLSSPEPWHLLLFRWRKRCLSTTQHCNLIAKPCAQRPKDARSGFLFVIVYQGKVFPDVLRDLGWANGTSSRQHKACIYMSVHVHMHVCSSVRQETDLSKCHVPLTCVNGAVFSLPWTCHINILQVTRDHPSLIFLSPSLPHSFSLKPSPISSPPFLEMHTPSWRIGTTHTFLTQSKSTGTVAPFLLAQNMLQAEQFIKKKLGRCQVLWWGRASSCLIIRHRGPQRASMLSQVSFSPVKNHQCHHESPF